MRSGEALLSTLNRPIDGSTTLKRFIKKRYNKLY